MSTALKTRRDGRTYYVWVNDDGQALHVAVVNVNGVLRKFWRHDQLASPRTREIIAAAGAVRL